MCLFRYRIILQSDELDETGISEDTQEWEAEFLSPQNLTSLSWEYQKWLQIGYHLVTFKLLQVKARFPGDELFCRSVWTAPGYEANEDEF